MELTKAQVARRVKFITQAKLSDNWDWGMEPYSRKELPLVVSLLAVYRLAAAWPVFVLIVFLFVCSSSLGSRLRMATWSRRFGRQIMLIRLTKPATMRARRRLSKPPRGQNDPPPSLQHEELEQVEGQAPPSSEPIRVVPLSVRLPAASASTPKGRKRTTERTTAQLEAKAKKQRRAGPKVILEAVG
jgi:hypothetical protein